MVRTKFSQDHMNKIESQREIMGSKISKYKVLVQLLQIPQLSGVIGLKFRNPETNTMRGIRCSDKQLYPPNQQAEASGQSQALWGKLTYICTRAKPPARTPASKVVTE